MNAAVPVLRARLRRAPLILCYHSVGVSPPHHDPEFLRVDTGQFRRQIELLAEAGARFTTVSELARDVRAGTAQPGQVAVTFDDGYEDNLTIALPILQSLDATATVFVTTGLVGRPGPWMAPESGIRMMDAGELRELAAAGVELGGHTITHPDLATLDAAACAREIGGGRRELEELIGQPVSSFAFPFFRHHAIARAAVAEGGYEAACAGLGYGSFNDPLLLPRALVGRKDGELSFVARVAGLHEPLYNTRAGRALRAGSRPLRASVRSVLDRVRR